MGVSAYKVQIAFFKAPLRSAIRYRIFVPCLWRRPSTNAGGRSDGRPTRGPGGRLMRVSFLEIESELRFGILHLGA